MEDTAIMHGGSGLCLGVSSCIFIERESNIIGVRTSKMQIVAIIN